MTRPWTALHAMLADFGFFWVNFWCPGPLGAPLGAPLGLLWAVFLICKILAVLPILSAFSPLSLHASKTPRRVTRSANNPAALALGAMRMGGVESPCKACMLHAACALRMQFTLMHSVHGMKCRAFSMLCWGGYPQDTAKNTVFTAFTQ